MTKTKEKTEDFAYGIKVGDFVTSYHKGYHIVVDIEKRYHKEGDEYSSLIEYRNVMNSKFKTKKSQSTQNCDASYCKKIDIAKIRKEKNEKVKELKEGYDRLIDLTTDLALTSV